MMIRGELVDHLLDVDACSPRGGVLVDHLLGDGPGGGEMADHGHSQANGDVDANSPGGGEMVDSGDGDGDVATNGYGGGEVVVHGHSHGDGDVADHVHFDDDGEALYGREEREQMVYVEMMDGLVSLGKCK